MSGAIALGDNAALAAVSAPAAGHYLLFYRAGVLTKMAPDGTETAIGAGGGGSSPPFSDAAALVKDDADATKLVRVDAGTVATGTTRVLTMPNADVNLGALVNANIDAAAAIAESKLNLASDAAAGTASRRTLGTGAAQAAPGNDSRLSDTRTPTDNTVTDAKVTAGAAIAESKLNLASDAAAGTASRRTLGTGATQAAPGNDSRFTHYSIRDWAFSGTLTTATGTMRVPIHAAGTVTSIRAMVNTAPTGASIIIDVNKNGTTMYTTQGNRPTIAISGTAVNATLPDVTSLAAGDYLTVDIDQVGSTIAGANLVVSVRYSY